MQFIIINSTQHNLYIQRDVEIIFNLAAFLENMLNNEMMTLQGKNYVIGSICASLLQT